MGVQQQQQRHGSNSNSVETKNCLPRQARDGRKHRVVLLRTRRGTGGAGSQQLSQWKGRDVERADVGGKDDLDKCVRERLVRSAPGRSRDADKVNRSDESRCAGGEMAGEATRADDQHRL